jgi:hypothetical protein
MILSTLQQIFVCGTQPCSLCDSQDSAQTAPFLSWLAVLMFLYLLVPGWAGIIITFIVVTLSLIVSHSVDILDDKQCYFPIYQLEFAKAFYITRYRGLYGKDGKPK